MTIAIIGSRTFDNYLLMKKVIKEYFSVSSITKIVSGGAIGADTLGEKFADEFNIPKIIYIPDWARYGKQAGFIRNELIVKAADFIFCFWDNKSNGTRHSIELCKKLNKGYLVTLF